MLALASASAPRCLLILTAASGLLLNTAEARLLQKYVQYRRALGKLSKSSFLDQLTTDSVPVGTRSIAYIKVKKTGSSTFAGVMRRIASRHGYEHAHDGPEWKDNDCCNSDLALWSNHGTRREMASFLSLRMPDAFFVTSVREPISRSMSHLYFKHVYIQGEEPTLENKLDWLKSDIDLSPQYTYDYIRPSVEEWSPKRVLESYDIVVVMERTAESLLVLASLSGASLVDVLYTISKDSTSFQNGGALHMPFEDEPKEVRELAKSMYSKCKDAELYQIANKILDQKLSKLGHTHKSDLERLNSMLASVRNHCAVEAEQVYEFEPGKMGISYDESGIITEVFSNGQASRKGIKKGYGIVSLGDVRFSENAVVVAEESGVPYQVTFKVMEDCLWHDNGCNQECIDRLAQQHGWY